MVDQVACALTDIKLEAALLRLMSEAIPQASPKFCSDPQRLPP